MRPIDADALDKAAAELPIRLPFDKRKILCLIAAAPTVDAVEVTRCENCCASVRIDEALYCCHWGKNTDENGYCHEGG